MTLSIKDLTFDTYEQQTSVITLLSQFEKAVNFAQAGEADKKRPPTYVFTWGSYQYIRCFVTSLNYTLTMFLPDGTPVRAKVDLTLEEIDESTSQPGMSASQPSAATRASDTRKNRGA